MYCIKCGYQNEPDARFCNNCGIAVTGTKQRSDLPPQTPVNNQSPNLNSPEQMLIQNTSGQGKLSALPPELAGWNWGAFFLTWIWGIRNSTMIAFLTLVPLVGFVMIFVLGAKGNEWAWQNKKWNSVKEFVDVQRRWSKAGLLIFSIIAIIVIASIVGSDGGTYYAY